MRTGSHRRWARGRPVVSMKARITTNLLGMSAAAAREVGCQWNQGHCQNGRSRPCRVRSKWRSRPSAISGKSPSSLSRTGLLDGSRDDVIGMRLMVVSDGIRNASTSIVLAHASSLGRRAGRRANELHTTTDRGRRSGSRRCWRPSSAAAACRARPVWPRPARHAGGRKKKSGASIPSGQRRWGSGDQGGDQGIRAGIRGSGRAAMATGGDQGTRPGRPWRGVGIRGQGRAGHGESADLLCEALVLGLLEVLGQADRRHALDAHVRPVDKVPGCPRMHAPSPTRQRPRGNRFRGAAVGRTFAGARASMGGRACGARRGAGCWRGTRRGRSRPRGRTGCHPAARRGTCRPARLRRWPRSTSPNRARWTGPEATVVSGLRVLITGGSVGSWEGAGG